MPFVALTQVAGPFARDRLGNGGGVEIYIPSTSPGSTLNVQVVLGTSGAAIGRARVRAGYNEAAASYVLSQAAEAQPTGAGAIGLHCGGSGAACAQPATINSLSSRVRSRGGLLQHPDPVNRHFAGRRRKV